MRGSENKPVRVRLAPSPTGLLHIGTARTALFNWLFARKNNGSFVLRIEDTDRERSGKTYETGILEGLSWLGLDWDEGPKLDDNGYTGKFGPYRQSERLEIYENYLKKLLDNERAYYCYCTKDELEAERQAMISQGLPPKYTGHCRDLKMPPPGKKPQVIRFKTPEAVVEFKDIIRGKISFDANLFGDIVIAKDLKTPLYNFASVVDDFEMQISHVIRGEDHISNTPKQILLQKALGFDEPQYAHLPLILSGDRSKLSKRFIETSLLDYRKDGYLPEAVINFLALLGWHSKEEKEVFSKTELIDEFELGRIQKAGAIFNHEKLNWLQKEHLKKLSIEKLAELLQPFLKKEQMSASKDFLLKVIAIERSRLGTLGEFLELAGFFFKLPDYDVQLLVWQKDSPAKTKTILGEIYSILEKTSDFDREKFGKELDVIVAKEGRGSVLWPLRVALSGQATSPDPLDIIYVLGHEESEKRLQVAIEKISKI